MNEIETYISEFSPDIQERLNAIYAIVKEEVPEATERICMKMPTFYLYKKWFFHFAAFKKHIGIYPQPSGVEAFLDRLSDYKTSKGAIQFPHSKPLPLDMIREIVKYRYMESEKEQDK